MKFVADFIHELNDNLDRSSLVVAKCQIEASYALCIHYFTSHSRTWLHVVHSLKRRCDICV